MEKRLAFGAVFLLGTLAAALGWMLSITSSMQWLRSVIEGNTASVLAIGGHVLQIIGVIGAMLVPDAEQDEPQEEVFMDE